MAKYKKIRKPIKYETTNIKHCVILGSGANLSFFPENKKDDFFLDDNFFTRSKTKRLLEKKYKKINDFKNFFFKKRIYVRDDEKIDIGMEEFFSFVDQLYQWIYIKDTEGKYISGHYPYHFHYLPYTLFSEVLCRESSNADINKALIEYDTKTLKKFQKSFLKEVGYKSKHSQLFDFENVKENIIEIRWLLPRLINELCIQIAEATYPKKDNNFNKQVQIYNKPYGLKQVAPKLFKDFLSKSVDGQNQKRLEELALISFNYDLVPDVTLYELLKQNKREREWFVDLIYLQLFEPYPDKSKDKIPTLNQLPMLLKPHGSINWVNYPPSSDSKKKSWLWVDKRNERPFYYTDKFLEDYGLVPRIFPPWVSKIAEFTEEGPVAGYVRQWVLMLDALKNAKKWTFIGYSLQPSDFQTKMLISMAIAHLKYKLEVIIIDPANFNNDKLKPVAECTNLSKFFMNLSSRKIKCEHHPDLNSYMKRTQNS